MHSVADKIQTIYNEDQSERKRIVLMDLLLAKIGITTARKKALLANDFIRVKQIEALLANQPQLDRVSKLRLATVLVHGFIAEHFSTALNTMHSIDDPSAEEQFIRHCAEDRFRIASGLPQTNGTQSEAAVAKILRQRRAIWESKQS